MFWILKFISCTTSIQMIQMIQMIQKIQMSSINFENYKHDHQSPNNWPECITGSESLLRLSTSYLQPIYGPRALSKMNHPHQNVRAVRTPNFEKRKQWFIERLLLKLSPSLSLSLSFSDQNVWMPNFESKAIKNKQKLNDTTFLSSEKRNNYKLFETFKPIAGALSDRTRKQKELKCGDLEI